MVFNPQGKAPASIRLPGRCANLTFAGPRNIRPYMASSHSPYALYVEAHGATEGRVDRPERNTDLTQSQNMLFKHQKGG